MAEIGNRERLFSSLGRPESLSISQLLAGVAKNLTAVENLHKINPNNPQINEAVMVLRQLHQAILRESLQLTSRAQETVKPAEESGPQVGGTNEKLRGQGGFSI